MLNSIKTAALAATMTLAGLAYAAPASAQGVEFFIGPDGVRVRAADYCERNRDDRRCRDYWSDRRGGGRDGGMDRRGRDGGWDRPRPRGCSAEDALDTARDMGLRRARVVDEGRRTVDVAGMTRRGRVVYTFSKAPGCRVLGREYVGGPGPRY